MGVGGTGKLRVNTPARIAQDDTRLWGSKFSDSKEKAGRL